MSTDLESDTELRALRNELLTGLQKKRNSFDTTSVYAQEESTLNPNEEKNDPVQKAAEEEDELEMLRLQALGAKRSRDNTSTSSSNLKVKIGNVVPGRFRYDKGSDDEEDEDEDEDEEDELYRVDEAQDKHETSSSLNETHNEEQEPSINEGKDSNNNTDLTGRFSTNSQQRNYQYNYQTYRTECSKLMSNEEYEPINQYEPQPGNSSDLDLRNFSRQKAVSQNQQNSLDTFTGKGNIGFYTDYTNPDDIVYSEPITRPIEITNSFMYTRGGYRNNSRNFNRFQTSYCVNNLSGETVKQRHRYAGDAQGKVLCHGVSNLEDVDNSLSTDSGSDEEESFLSNKKLKSVIVKAVISTDTTKSAALSAGDKTRSRSRSRDHSRNRHHKRIK